MNTNVRREPHRVTVGSQDLNLNVLTLGSPTLPALVMVHGIRDTAMGLMPVAQSLADDFHVVVPDLRGHGDSDKPGHYAIPQFVYDLHRVLQALSLDCPAIFGHSLGGQIVARFAAQFPERVCKLVIAEGLGPPRRPHDDVPDARAEGARIIATMETPARMRPLPSLEFATARLIANNPRLPEGRARWIAEHSTAIDERGERQWKFDPRVGELWLAMEPMSNEARWRQIEAPVLVVTAELADEYWRGQMPIPGWSGKFSTADLGARLACFRDAQHVHMEAAGHMLHFDRPEDLARIVRDFLR